MVHANSQQVGSEYYDAKQTSYFSIVSWVNELKEDGTYTKKKVVKYADYMSSSLEHSVLATRKAMSSFLLNKLQNHPYIEKIIILSDSGPVHFKSKEGIYSLNKTIDDVCTELKEKGLLNQDHHIKGYWFFFPPYHGKGPCDGRGNYY